MSYSLSQLDAIGDVDPVAEADVYLAYGRDLQAEEILKEAMRANPERLAIRTKLLEVYAKRRDTKGFELLATQLYALTRGEGEDWVKAQELGAQIDPDNPLYRAGRPSGSARRDAEGQPSLEPLGASTMPQSFLPVAFELGAPRCGRAAAAPPESVDLDLDLDRATTPRRWRRRSPSSPTQPLSRLRTLSLPDLNLPGDDRARARAGSRKRRRRLGSLDFDFEGMSFTSTASSPPAAPAEPASQTMRLDEEGRRSACRASSNSPTSSARSATWKARATCCRRCSRRPTARSRARRRACSTTSAEEGVNLSAARADLGPALLAVRRYGCGARPDLSPLATKSSRLFRPPQATVSRRPPPRGARNSAGPSFPCEASAMRLALGVAYRGSAYQGWQSQPDGRTLQDQLERALSRFADRPLRTLCAGRTDAGVHGLNQVVHLDAPVGARGLLLGARHEPLPACRHRRAMVSCRVADDFHARASALGRRYAYVLLESPVRPALEAGHCGWSFRPLDGAAMRAAARPCSASTTSAPFAPRSARRRRR